MVVGTQPAKREEGLGGKHECEQRGAQVELTVHQPQPDRDRHERDCDRRDELEDQRRQEGDPQRRHRGGAVALGDLTDRAGLRLGPPEHLQRGKPGHDVEEMAG